MSNDLIKSSALPASLTEAMSMGKVFFESGLFTDLRSAAQAVVKIQAGSELGIAPFAALVGIHIIAGKPVLGAGLIASRIKGSGKYDYEVIEHSDKICSIDFFQGKKKIGNSTFTIEDAKKAGTKNIDKFPKNMLFARALSNGVKWFTPDIFSGPIYTPEDFDQSEPPAKTEDTGYVEVTEQKSEAVKAEVIQPVVEPPHKKKLSDQAFAKACTRIEGGELMVIQQLRDTFVLNDGQQATLKAYEAMEQGELKLPPEPFTEDKEKVPF